MFSKAFRNVLANDANVIPARGRALVRISRTSRSRLFPRRNPDRADESQGGEMCFSILIRRFEGDDGRRTLAGFYRGCTWKGSIKKILKFINRTQEARLALPCAFLAPLFLQAIY